MKLDGPLLTKILTVVAMLGGALYFAVIERDSHQAVTLLMGAAGLAGLSAGQHKVEAKAEAIEADTINIRENPNMPGTPR